MLEYGWNSITNLWIHKDIFTQSIPFGMENNSNGYWKKIGIQKALKIRETMFWQSEAINHNNNLTFISNFTPNKPKVRLRKTGVNTFV